MTVKYLGKEYDYHGTRFYKIPRERIVGILKKQSGRDSDGDMYLCYSGKDTDYVYVLEEYFFREYGVVTTAGEAVKGIVGTKLSMLARSYDGYNKYDAMNKELDKLLKDYEY